jgi:hypothetical protein
LKKGTSRVAEIVSWFDSRQGGHKPFPDFRHASVRGYISGGGAANEGENGNVSEHDDASGSRIDVRGGTRAVL